MNAGSDAKCVRHNALYGIYLYFFISPRSIVFLVERKPPLTIYNTALSIAENNGEQMDTTERNK